MPARKKSTAAPRTRAKYHHGSLRRALLDATIAHSATFGADTVTLREVARRAGVSANAPYNHFADKGALLAAVAEEGLIMLRDAMVGARERATTPGAELEAIGVAYVTFAIRHHHHFRLF